MGSYGDDYGRGRSRSRSPGRGGGGGGGKMTGVALRWNAKGFGFIKPDDGGEVSLKARHLDCTDSYQSGSETVRS